MLRHTRYAYTGSGIVSDLNVLYIVYLYTHTFPEYYWILGKTTTLKYKSKLMDTKHARM